MFFEMRFDLGTLDSGERLLPFGLLVGFVMMRLEQRQRTTKTLMRLRRRVAFVVRIWHKQVFS